MPTPIENWLRKSRTFPPVLWLLVTSSCFQLGRAGLQLACWAFEHCHFNALLDAAAAAAASGDAGEWRIRRVALEFVWLVGQRFALEPPMRARVVEVLQTCLADSAPEVRDAAHRGLAGLLRMEKPQFIRALIEAAPAPRKRGPSRAGEESLAQRHGRVLAVAAAVRSQPTDLPDWMADAVSALCRLQSEDPLVRQTIVAVVADFKKTHQDVWPLISATWDPDQLSLMSEFSGARSFYS